MINVFDSRSDEIASAAISYTIYLIKTLTPDHYYVGWTSNTDKRWAKHLGGKGAKFTKKHGVESITILCKTNKMKEAEWREKYYNILLRIENPSWTVSSGAPLNNIYKVLNHFGYKLSLLEYLKSQLPTEKTVNLLSQLKPRS